MVNLVSTSDFLSCLGVCKTPGCSNSMCGQGTCRDQSSPFSSNPANQSRQGCDCPLGSSGDRCQIQEHIQVVRNRYKSNYYLINAYQPLIALYLYNCVYFINYRLGFITFLKIGFIFILEKTTGLPKKDEIVKTT